MPEPIHAAVAPVKAEAGNPETWMEGTFKDAPQTRLTDIVIPGTHNSATSTMQAGNAWALGCSERVPGFLRATFARWAAFLWSRCQTRTVSQQLQDGIRFLDLRVSPCGKDRDTLHIVHGLACSPYSNVLDEIAQFVKSHPHEVVVIKSRIAYDCRKEHCEQAELSAKAADAELHRVLGDRMYKRGNAHADITFGKLWHANRNVVLIGSGCTLVDTWGKTHTEQQDALVTNVKAVLHKRAPAAGAFHEVGVYLTPQGGRSAVMQTLRSFNGWQVRVLQKGLLSQIGKLVEAWAGEGLKPNVVSVDFYESTGLVPAAMRINQGRVGDQAAPAAQPTAVQ